MSSYQPMVWIAALASLVLAQPHVAPADREAPSTQVSSTETHRGPAPMAGEHAIATAPPSGPVTTYSQSVGPAPCTDGTWGHISDPGNAIHVRTWGDKHNDGTATSPFDTLKDALKEASKVNGSGPIPIAVGPGVFETGETLKNKHDGVVIQGCGIGDTVLAAEDADKPVLEFRSAHFGVEGLTVDGGARSLKATSSSQVTLTSVRVERSNGTAIYGRGSNTVLDLVDVEVVEPLPSDDGCGWGVHTRRATLLWAGGFVEDASEVGVYVDRGEFVIDGVSIDGTKSRWDGTLGRGLHVDKAWGVLSNSSFTDNNDASVFLRRPQDIIIGHIVIDITGAGFVPGSSDWSGDGVVAVGRKAGGDAARFEHNLVSDSERSMLLLENVYAGIDGNKGFHNATLQSMGAQVFIQGDNVQVQGSDTPQVYDLGSVGGSAAMKLLKQRVRCVP